jgi:glycosyltransferase involved in cell wall biosynthesis
VKILIINYRFHLTGGPERYMFNIISEFEKLGHIIIPFSVDNPKNQKTKYSDYFAKNISNSREFLFEKYKKNIGFYLSYLSREFYSIYIKNKLNKLIKDTRPDICYLLPHKPPLSVSVIDALRKNRVPVVHRISDYNIICAHGGLYRNRNYCNDCISNTLSLIKYKCVKGSLVLSITRYFSMKLHKTLKIYDKIDHFVTTNDFAKKQFIEFGFNAQRITTIETFAVQATNFPKQKNNDPLVLLCVGNIDDSKGTFDLVKTLGLLQKE